jgi:hypothetical protein
MGIAAAVGCPEPHGHAPALTGPQIAGLALQGDLFAPHGIDACLPTHIHALRNLHKSAIQGR